jgi:hypothetical protein
MEVGDDSESEGSFAGFNPEDITLHEANNESDINVSESDVSSVHTSDLSDWEDRLTDVDEFDVDDRPRDIHWWTPVITPIHCEDFQVRTGPNITFDVSTGSELYFFFRFEANQFEDIATQTNEYARVILSGNQLVLLR